MKLYEDLRTWPERTLPPNSLEVPRKPPAHRLATLLEPEHRSVEDRAVLAHKLCRYFANDLLAQEPSEWVASCDGATVRLLHPSLKEIV